MDVGIFLVECSKKLTQRNGNHLFAMYHMRIQNFVAISNAITILMQNVAWISSFVKNVISNEQLVDANFVNLNIADVITNGADW